jgi:hypothetical protein
MRVSLGTYVHGGEATPFGQYEFDLSGPPYIGKGAKNGQRESCIVNKKTGERVKVPFRPTVRQVRRGHCASFVGLKSLDALVSCPI